MAFLRSFDDLGDPLVCPLLINPVYNSLASDSFVAYYQVMNQF